MDKRMGISYDVEYNHKTAVARTASTSSASHSSLPAQSDDSSASATGAKVEHLQIPGTGVTASDGNAHHNPKKMMTQDRARRARTLPIEQPRSSLEAQEEGSNGLAQGTGRSAPRPALSTRRTPTNLPTLKNARAPSDEPLALAQRLPRHAATLPLERCHEGSEEAGQSTGREKKKGVSFLSRFIPGAGNSNKKQNHAASRETLGSLAERAEHEAAGDESNESSHRPEGMDAQVFSYPEGEDDVEGIGYHPKHPQPPPYVKFRSKFKKDKEFDRVFLAQELQAGRPRPPRRRTASSLNSPALQGTPLESDENAVWTLEFSKDGKYLAAAGQDKIVRIWAVLSSADERRQHQEEEEEGDKTAKHHARLEAPVFRKRPIREYEGHEGPIVDLSWSKNNFLLSASADKTVRLWHTTRTECLCTFKHTEHVHSVQFHPRDDRFFLAGSRDMKLRFWSIPDKSVAFWQQLNEIITAVAFTPDGKTAIAGTVNGGCNFYETEGLKYQTQIQVRSAYGKNAKPSKICSIDTVNLSEGKKADVKLLISSNDSRIRLYNFRDKSLETKFKGHKSEERTIKAKFSDDGQHIIGGSEDKAAYIWSMGPSESEKPSQRPVEFFEATTSQTTCAALAPTQSRQLLAASEDPIFDLCNPPPVTLLSRSESVASGHAPSRINSVAGAPRGSESPRKRPNESPAFLAKSTHSSGSIIVTASNTGVIRVYRQDCASTNRAKQTETDANSIFSGKRPSSIYMARAMSRTSTNGPQRSNSKNDSLNTQPPHDRIMTWRQGISSEGSLHRKTSDAVSTRSMSPSKSGYSFRRSGSIKRSMKNGKAGHGVEMMTRATESAPAVTLERASTPVRESEGSGQSPPSVKHGTSSAPLSKQTSRTTADLEVVEARRTSKDSGKELQVPHDDQPTPLGSPSSPSSPSDNPLWLNGGQSFLSWNMKEYASQALKRLQPITSITSTNKDGHLRPDLPTQNSTLTVVSRLSSEGSPAEHTPEEGNELKHAETLRCRKCGRGSFKAKAMKGGKQVLECQRCGTIAGDT